MVQTFQVAVLGLGDKLIFSLLDIIYLSRLL